MNKKKTISMISLAAIAVVAMVTVSPYFYDVTVDEALPTASAELPAGKFVGSGDGIHEAEGKVQLIKLEDGSQYVRFENFKSTNGPDLFVYLATDDQASDFVKVGAYSYHSNYCYCCKRYHGNCFFLIHSKMKC